MLEKSESFLRGGNPIQRVLAGAIRNYFDAGGKDIPFSTEQTLNLEQATREYKNNPDDPQLLTDFMFAFWAKSLPQKSIEETFTVDAFPLTTKEIEEKRRKGYMAIFVPDGVTREDLGKMFPEMKNWATQEEYSVVDVNNNSGWLWIEASVDAPNLNITQEQMKEKFKKEGKQGQSLRTYIIGSQISKLLTGKYFDEEGSTWSRLLGSCYEGAVPHSVFDSSGRLSVSTVWYPGSHDGSTMGSRSEEVIKLQS